MSTDAERAAVLYPNLPTLELGDLESLHAAYGTELADRPSDLEGINRELGAMQVAPVDARQLVHRMTAYMADAGDDRARLRAHAEAERAMGQMHPQTWERERSEMVAWLQKTAPGVHRLLVTTTAANDVEVLRTLLGAYRRRRT